MALNILGFSFCYSDFFIPPPPRKQSLGVYSDPYIRPSLIRFSSETEFHETLRDYSYCTF